MMAVLRVGLSLFLDAPRVLHEIGVERILPITSDGGSMSGELEERSAVDTLVIRCLLYRPVRWGGGGVVLPTNQGAGLDQNGGGPHRTAIPKNGPSRFPF
ncbi:unnamed protein product [Nezara viridula]|uniref:Uncharacterized protein n=1 Tax=Nezara viridula TaxID=85310 RepID=A0A9P0MV31_NEZVI|nr:unnamed protein product [Nezara viridula]